MTFSLEMIAERKEKKKKDRISIEMLISQTAIEMKLNKKWSIVEFF